MKKIKEIDQIKMGAVLSYVIIFLNIIVSLFYTPILIRCLGQSEYGLYSLVSSIISYLTILDLGFGNAIILYTTKYRVNKQEEAENKLHGMFFLIYIFIGIVAALLSLILYFNINKLFSNTITYDELSKSKVLIIILTVNLALSFPLSIFSSIITAYEKFVFSKLVNIIRIILTPIIMIPLLLNGYKSIALTIVVTILNISSLLINLIYCICKLNIKFNFGGFNFKLLREISAFSIWIFLNIIIDKINWNIDQYILGAINGTIAVSVYSIGSQINTLYLTFSTAISSVLFPKTIKMEEENVSASEFTKIFIYVGRIQFIILGIILTGFILFGKVFMKIWAGEEYINSYYVACILMIPMTIPLIQSLGLNILQAKNKNKFRTLVFLGISVLNILISVPLAKKYSEIGCSIGTSIAVVLGQVIVLNFYYHKAIHINIILFWKRILKTFIPILLSFLVGIVYVCIFNINNIYILILGIFLYAVVYVCFIWIFEIDKNEKEKLKQIFNKLHNEEKIDESY